MSRRTERTNKPRLRALMHEYLCAHEQTKFPGTYRVMREKIFAILRANGDYSEPSNPVLKARLIYAISILKSRYPERFSEPCDVVPDQEAIAEQWRAQARRAHPKPDHPSFCPEYFRQPQTKFTVVDFDQWHKQKAERSAFYDSDEWRSVRYQALKLHGGACQCCGRRPDECGPLHVDHIKPRSKYPDLELELSNLQVLCKDCNFGKSNRDETDWRTTARREPTEPVMRA